MAWHLRKLSLNLPFGLGGAEVEISQVQAQAAWSLYVELTTRIAVQPLTSETGLAREALNSLYSLFSSTRDVLKHAGPDVADGPQSLGPLAIKILNDGLRPFISRWHPAIHRFELQAGPNGDEANWPDRVKFYEEFEINRQELAKYSEMLARIAGIRE